MKINRLLFNNKDYVIEEDLDFSDVTLDPTHIRKINSAHVKVSGFDYEDYLILNIELDADVTSVCSYTLEDLPYKVHLKTALSFSYEEEEDVIQIDGPIFELDPYLLDLIVSEVPLTLVKKGAKLPSSGKDYRVLSEDEYNKEQENKVDSRWAKLDDIDL